MSRIQKIVAATDFSAPARHAAMRAAMLSSENGAHLTLIHVANAGLLDALRRLLVQSGETLARQLLDEANGEMRQLMKMLGQRYGVEADEHVTGGAVLEEIIAHTESIEADLMVMGARGAGATRELLLGSTTERVLRKTARPLLIVKQMPHEPYRRVLVPVDFSTRSMAAIELAQRVAPNAHLILLNAFEAPFERQLRYAGINDFEVIDLRAAAKREAMEKMAELASRSGISERLQCLVLPGPATHCILEQEQEQDCDLIVIGKRGHSALEEFMMGSVTKHVLALSNSDLLVTDRHIA